jgi:hypothetical protein
MKAHIVIPIGVGAPGTPHPAYLRDSIESIINQTSSEWILTVASDSNVSDEVKELLQEYEGKIKVKWFEPFSFFRKGSIWKKIWDCWQEDNAEFLAFLHYDDVWEKSKLEEQLKFIEANNLKIATSRVFQIDVNRNVVSPDLSGGTYAICHSMLIRREAIEASNLLLRYNEWAAYFERVLIEEMVCMGNWLRCDSAVFYHRTHDKSITNTMHENAEYVKEQTAQTGYTLRDMYNKL